MEERSMYEDSENSAALAKLAREIHEEHEKAGEALRQGLEHALNAGRLLLEARSLSWHGTWERWTRENCRFALSTARLYMQLARNEAVIKSLSVSESPNTISEARRVLRDARPNAPLDEGERRAQEGQEQLKVTMRTELNNVGRNMLRHHVATKGSDELRYAYSTDQQQLLSWLRQLWCKAEEPTRRKFLRWLKEDFGLRLENTGDRFRAPRAPGGNVVRMKPKGKRRKSGRTLSRPQRPENT
jgi:hypothetical protein